MKLNHTRTYKISSKRDSRFLKKSEAFSAAVEACALTGEPQVLMEFNKKDKLSDWTIVTTEKTYDRLGEAVMTLVPDKPWGKS